MDKQNLIEELKALEAQATPRPWHVGESRGAWPMWTIEHGLVGETCGEHDAKLISIMRNALPDLLAHISQLEAERDAAVEDLKEWNNPCSSCVHRPRFSEDYPCRKCQHAKKNRCHAGFVSYFEWRNPARKG